MKGRRRVRMGTRGSRLALAQAQRVAAALCRRWPGLVVETVVIRTRGDVTVRPLGELGGDGLFTRAIEEALLEGRVDLAVHSAKDLPTRLAGGCVVAAWPERASVADVLVSRTGAGLAELPPGARVGTSSPRRAALLRELRPDLAVVPLRGNVETRLRRVEEGEVDAAVLAEAGLVRLGLETCRTQRLDPAVFVPAAGQGALAVEVRADDGQAAALAAAIADPPTAPA
ncbi:MAG: hydroxymethylbilane synthase, partial [Clostridia bacterium]|nr:hydroxymethylbilane synthase [Clostridia bacterium]